MLACKGFAIAALQKRCVVQPRSEEASQGVGRCKRPSPTLCAHSAFPCGGRNPRALEPLSPERSGGRWTTHPGASFGRTSAEFVRASLPLPRPSVPPAPPHSDSPALFRVVAYAHIDAPPPSDHRPRRRGATASVQVLPPPEFVCVAVAPGAMSGAEAPWGARGAAASVTA